MRTKLIAVLAALLLTVTCSSAAHADTGSGAGSGTVAVGTTPDAPDGLTRVTLGWIQSEIRAGWGIAPSRWNGYASMKFTALAVQKNGDYVMTYDLSYDSPLAVTAGGSSPTPDATDGGFCWPWDNGPGSSCWNNPDSWDWGSWWHQSEPKQFDYSRQEQCAKGAISTVFTQTLKSGLAAIFGKKSLIAPNPAGFVIGAVGGCIINLYRHFGD